MFTNADSELRAEFTENREELAQLVHLMNSYELHQAAVPAALLWHNL